MKIKLQLLNKVLFYILFILINSFSFGKSYFVKEGGNDSNDGLSDANAWASIEKVNNFDFESGDDVYFKCGSVWLKKTLFIDWAGTEDNRVIIGAYYDDGIIGVDGDKPRIDGEYVYPSLEYSKLVSIDRDYVTVENLHVQGSLGRGIVADSKHDIIVQNCYVEKTFNQGIIFITVQNGQILSNELKDCARKRQDDGGSVYSTSLAVVNQCSDIVIRYNIVHDTHGEAINSFNRNDGVLIERNICYDFRSVGIYMDNSQNVIVRYNLVYNTADKTYWRTSSGPGMGIWNTVEPFGQETYNKNISVYGNLIAWCKIGIVSTGDNHEYVPAYNVKYYNNTVIDCETNFQTWGNQFDSCQISNNIFYKVSPYCVQSGISSPPTGLAIYNNLWSSSVPEAMLGEGSILADPKLIKTEGWRNLLPGEVQANIFGLLSSSPAIDAGKNFGVDFENVLDEASIFPYDIINNNQNDYGNGWDIGGIVYSGISLQASNPTPINKAEKLDTAVTLSWTPADSVIEHLVYLGEDYELNYYDSTTDSTYELIGLKYDTKYSWRIDEVISDDTIKGLTWTFKTSYEKLPPEIAFSPLPINNQTEVQLNAKLTWSPGYRSESYKIYFGTINPPPYVKDLSDIVYTSDSLELNTKYYWKINTLNEFGETEGEIWTFTTIENNILPENWFSQDIGSVNIPGLGKENSGIFTISASGTTNSLTNDELQFTYFKNQGDVEIIAKFVGFENPYSGSEAGLMIRENLTDDSKFSSISVTDIGQIISKVRIFEGENLTAEEKKEISLPIWLKLNRLADKYFVGQISEDSINWTGVKSEELSFNSDTYVGLYGVSNNSDSLTTSIFSNVKINGVLVSVDDAENLVPTKFEIGNYPNPFNPETNIIYSLPKDQKVKITVYDVLGRKVKVLLNQIMKSGKHSVVWNGTSDHNSKVSSGIYFYKVDLFERSKVGKMILLQ